MSIKERGLALEKLTRFNHHCPHPRKVVRCDSGRIVLVYECVPPDYLKSVLVRSFTWAGEGKEFFGQRIPNFIQSERSRWEWNKDENDKWRRWPWFPQIK